MSILSTSNVLLLLLVCITRMDQIHAFHTPSSSISSQSTSNHRQQQTIQKMGIFDFLQSKKEDFIKLDRSSKDIIGPGPLILLYNVPNGIDNDELSMMIQDGAPITCSKGKGVGFKRIYPDDLQLDGYLNDQSVLQVLESLLSSAAYTTDSDTTNTNTNTGVVDELKAPILYFSGISNSEMMSTYKIIGKEIYEESGGTMNAACAKVVQPAYTKRFVQLIDEISGDHKDAWSTDSDTGDK